MVVKRSTYNLLGPHARYQIVLFSGFYGRSLLTSLHATPGQCQNPLPSRQQLEHAPNNKKYLQNGWTLQLLLRVFRARNGLHTRPRHIFLHLLDSKIPSQLRRRIESLQICTSGRRVLALPWPGHDSYLSSETETSTLEIAGKLAPYQRSSQMDVSKLGMDFILSVIRGQLHDEYPLRLHDHLLQLENKTSHECQSQWLVYQVFCMCGACGCSCLNTDLPLRCYQDQA